MKDDNKVPVPGSGSTTDPGKEIDCFFIQGLKADGKPFSYKMHKYIGISGGPGPMGSIESKSVKIIVPRSKRALSMHRIGFMIKTLSLIIALIILKPGLLPNQDFITKIIISGCIVTIGGIVTLVFYQVNKTRSKFFFAGSYQVVKDYKKRGYKRGGHPMMSTTPVGFIAWIVRLIF